MQITREAAELTFAGEWRPGCYNCVRSLPVLSTGPGMPNAEILYCCPDAPGQPAQPEESSFNPEWETETRRVMVVDDEMVVAESLVEILRMEGFQAIAVASGATAIKWAEILEPDALICDIAMPVIDGFETAKEIRKLLPNCRIILFSGHAGSQRLLANAPLKTTEFEFLAKPVKPEVLTEMLRNPRRR
jgi:CheY-like chemotaxis protein